MQKSDNRLTPKDLINIGIFTAIYFVVAFAVAMIGYIPIFIPLQSMAVPLAGGIPMMLMLTKVRKFGAMLILAVVVGAVYTVMGSGIWLLPIGIVSALAAEFIVKSGKYQSAKKAVLAYGVFCLAVFGNYMPIFFSRDAYRSFVIESGYGEEYADALIRYLPNWIAPVLVAACFAFGILGGLLGRAVLKKHFDRAGMA
ncbi:MAG: MptD family putative ECF transporter S component [Clostridiales bacterium]|nr:MptD family putative ECF transporter S component [Clostridiales bacterium]